MNSYKTTVIAAVVAILVFGIAAIVWLSIAGVGERTTPAIVTIVGLLAPTITALLALLRVEKVDQHLTENGVRIDEHAQQITELTRKANAQ